MLIAANANRQLDRSRIRSMQTKDDILGDDEALRRPYAYRPSRRRHQSTCFRSRPAQPEMQSLRPGYQQPGSAMMPWRSIDMVCSSVSAGRLLREVGRSAASQ